MAKTGTSNARMMESAIFQSGKGKIKIIPMQQKNKNPLGRHQNITLSKHSNKQHHFSQICQIKLKQLFLTLHQFT